MKNGAIYLLSRQVKGEHEESYMQNVTVFASSDKQALELVNSQFAQIRKVSKTPQPAYDVLPEFAVEKVTLNAYKMITAGITS
jgi:hypothetical protein